MLQSFLHAGALVSCGAASLAALYQSWRPAPRAGRWAGSLTSAASVIVVLDWLRLVARDWRLTTPAGVLVSSADAFIIVVGIAWIPCYFLLQIRAAGLRAASYIAACLLAILWIGWHVPTHAIPPQVKADTAAMHVAVALIGFAFLNFALLRKFGAAARVDDSQARLAWGTAAAACIATMAFIQFGRSLF